MVDTVRGGRRTMAPWQELMLFTIHFVINAWIMMNGTIKRGVLFLTLHSSRKISSI